MMILSEAFNKASKNLYLQFLFGAAGIYFFAFISSVYHEKL